MTLVNVARLNNFSKPQLIYYYSSSKREGNYQENFTASIYFLANHFLSTTLPDNALAPSEIIRL
jgi:hypothetical protein